MCNLLLQSAWSTNPSFMVTPSNSSTASHSTQLMKAPDGMPPKTNHDMYLSPRWLCDAADKNKRDVQRYKKCTNNNEFETKRHVRQSPCLTTSSHRSRTKRKSRDVQAQTHLKCPDNAYVCERHKRILKMCNVGYVRLWLASADVFKSERLRGH